MQFIYPRGRFTAPFAPHAAISSDLVEFMDGKMRREQLAQDLPLVTMHMTVHSDAKPCLNHICGEVALYQMPQVVREGQDVDSLH